MRIGIDGRLPTYRMGGISQYILHLVPALAELDRHNEYFLFHSRKETRSFVPEGAVNWKRRVLWTPCHHRFERPALTLELLPHQLDVLHSPDFIPPFAGARRRVITIHDLNFMYYPELLTPESRRYYLDQITTAVKDADGIAADSEATRQDIIKLLGVAPQKVRTIYLAANPIFQVLPATKEKEAVLKRFGLEPGFLIAVGTLEPRKNLPMLLRIYARLRQQESVRDPLVLVGRRGWLFEEIFQTIARLDLQKHVLHLENVSDQELACLYHGAGVLATPSLYEGFGLPALEAQHCGCPVVVSERGSLPEIVGEKGHIVKLEDEEEWVRTIARLLKDDAYRQAAISNGRLQAARFSWANTARSTLRLYGAQENKP